jgi:cytochrome c553
VSVSVQKNQATVVTERAKIAAPEIEIRGTVRGALGDPAAELRLPSIFQWPEKAEAGGLAAADSIKEKAFLCTSRHGKGGVSQTENIPSPAGQPDLFVQWQIFFRSGARKNDRRTTQQIRNLGASLRCSHPRRQSKMETGAKIAAGRGCANMNFRNA